MLYITLLLLSIYLLMGTWIIFLSLSWNLPFICWDPLLEISEILCCSLQWPAANHWLMQDTKGRNAVMWLLLQNCPWDQTEARHQLNLPLSLGLSLCCLISLLSGELEPLPQSFAQQCISGSVFRESTQNHLLFVLFSISLLAEWLFKKSWSGRRWKGESRVREQPYHSKSQLHLLL